MGSRWLCTGRIIGRLGKGSSVNFQQQDLVAGLYVVATPIGNARDITLRALDILASADVIAAEDTRTARKLMQIHGVPMRARNFVAHHDHSSDRDVQKLVDLVRQGRSVAYVAEAGTPMLSDPGFELVRAVSAAGLQVVAAPGASALLTALCVAGLPTDRIHFAGFLPPKSMARKAALAELARLPATVALYESPKRLRALLEDIAATMGPTRPCVVCRELTKKFESIYHGGAQDLLETISAQDLRGEIVVLIDRGAPQTDENDVEAALVKAMETLRVKDAATMVAGSFGLKLRDVYQLALRIKDEQE